ncbi:unnamed protein product [Ceratitis capitata]|uniref:(Mediterranean fruit fly) hypothetical protein n=1 Tax=Ceratitis capitata TaxID=7213 RepID=A0A811U905_CERCA|nr:unnamed protein product [Ceratitis capitata]
MKTEQGGYKIAQQRNLSVSISFNLTKHALSLLSSSVPQRAHIQYFKGSLHFSVMIVGLFISSQSQLPMQVFGSMEIVFINQEASLEDKMIIASREAVNVENDAGNFN